MISTDVSPPDLDLSRMFRGWSRFDDIRDWERGGFRSLRDKESKILVMGHADDDRYLFKKYSNDNYRSSTEQLDRYRSRIAGAERLRSHIAAHALKHVVVPRKWLCELPAESGSKHLSRFVVVTERLRILDTDESQRRYRRINDETATELCTVLFAFRGLDLTEVASRNAPFTRDGAIAFIDTEFIKPGSEKRKSRHRYYDKCVDSALFKQRRLANAMWKQLERAAFR